MARKNFNPPVRSDEEIAKEMNWIAQGAKKKTSSPSGQLDTLEPAEKDNRADVNSTKRKLKNHALKDGQVKRQRHNHSVIVEESPKVNIKSSKNNLTMPSERAKGSSRVPAARRDPFDVPDDPIPESTKRTSAPGAYNGERRKIRPTRDSVSSQHGENGNLTRSSKDAPQEPSRQPQSGEHNLTPSNTKLKRISASRRGASEVGQPVDPMEEDRTSNSRSASPEADSAQDGDDVDDAAGDSHDDNEPTNANQTMDIELAEDVELYGASSAWTDMCEGARSVGESNRQDVVVQDLPQLMTPEIKRLKQIIKKVTLLYYTLRKVSESDVEQWNEVQAQLSVSVAKLRAGISELEERKEDVEWNRNAIQDIYAHAIPRIVRMLEQALIALDRVYRKHDDVDAIQEIVDLQNLVLHLCQKAMRWRTKSDTDRPIRNSTRQLIYPRLRDNLIPAFQKELVRRKKALRLAEIALSAEDYAQTQRDADEEMEIRARIRDECLERISRDLDQRAHILCMRKGYSKYVQSDTDAPLDRQRPSGNLYTTQTSSSTDTHKGWTLEQDEVFLALLLDPRWTNHGAEKRYLSMLSARALQGKSLELLAERALDYKDDLMANPCSRRLVQDLWR